MDIGTYKSRNNSITFSSNTKPFQNSHFNNNTTFPNNDNIETSSNSSLQNSSTNYTFENGVFEKQKGLSWPITGLFVVGDMAGGGLVALPTAIVQLGIGFGIGISLIMNLLTMLTSLMLGASWNILIRRWPEYRSHCRKPYPEMAYRAIGPFYKTIVSLCIDLTQFGIAVVYLLLSAKNIHDAIKSFSNADISFCYVIIIVAACLLPALFLKSPQDFWGAVVLAMFTTAAAIILILIGSASDYAICHQSHHLPDFKLTNYFLGLGTLIASYGGHSAFPTIQHDMKKPTDFYKSTFLAFSILFCMYTPVSLMGFLTYGDALRESVINSIQIQWIQQAVNLLITIHCILTLTIVLNPLNQDIEDLLNVPHEFGIKRVLVRTGTMICVTFLAESVPNFGPMLDLMGGTTLALTCLILPPLFYVFLFAGEKRAERLKLSRGGFSDETDNEHLTFGQMFQEIPKYIFIICVIIAAIGAIGGAAATYSAIKELSTTQFKVPCYIQPFVSSDDSEGNTTSTNCCGRYQNLTTHDDVTCSSAKLDFYG
uniref:Amino acid transporter transmembrane domain-containing protein n=1 Tax=Panagrolaimus sp. ES5 TaxID=591445 RepID=A0AC34FU19_9BILA